MEFKSNRLTIEELSERLREYERKYGICFHRKALKPLMARTSLIIPWIGSRHPTRNISHERGGYHPYADAASGWQG